ncbi:MAG: hypothetical protein R6U95_06570 [Bacteroidales bacterium]
MKKIVVASIFACISISIYAQDKTYSLEGLTSDTTTISEIAISTEFQHDSISVDAQCVVKSDAIEVIVYEYKDVSIEFYKKGAYGPMTKQQLEATHTLFDIKTIFSGIYFLDVKKNGVTCKTFRIEKEF